MEHMNLHSELDDRILWYDGTSTVLSADIDKFLKYVNTGKIFTDEITPDIAKMNKMGNKVLRKADVNAIKSEWLIPQEILDIDLLDYAFEKLEEDQRLNKWSSEELNNRITRTEEELSILSQRNMIPIVYAILYVINTFTANAVVWGVGRGSSTSSYLLYLLGVHDVDCVKYDLDFSDFTK